MVYCGGVEGGRVCVTTYLRHTHAPPTLYKQRGNQHYAKKEFAEALAAYDAAIALDEGNMTFRTNKVNTRVCMRYYPPHHYHRRRVYVRL